MKTLVIHPKDRTTDFLSVLYSGNAEAEVYREKLTSRRVNELFHHCQPGTRIMLLGHGSDRGLFYRTSDRVSGTEDDTNPVFDGIQVGHAHRHFLKERHNIVGVFCNADQFALSEGLHGLFTGMIVSELSEAEEYGVRTTQAELDTENGKFASRLSSLLNSGCQLYEIPEKMKELDDVHSELTVFNYNNIHYI